jgi:hypothetical protein
MSESPPSSPKSPKSPEDKIKELKLKAFRELATDDNIANFYAEQLIKKPDMATLLRTKFGSERNNDARAKLITCIKCVLRNEPGCATCSTAFNGRSDLAKSAIQPSIDEYLSKDFEFISDKGTMSLQMMKLAAILLFRSNNFKDVKPYYPIPSHLFTVTGISSITGDCQLTKKVPPNAKETETTKSITPEEMKEILKEKNIMVVDSDGKIKINLGHMSLPGSTINPTLTTLTTNLADNVSLAFNPSPRDLIFITVPRNSTTIEFKFNEILLSSGATPVPTGFIDEYTWTCTVENLTFNYEKQQQAGGRHRRKTKSKTKRMRSRSKRLRMRARTRKGNKKNKSSRTRR